MWKQPFTLVFFVETPLSPIPAIVGMKQLLNEVGSQHFLLIINHTLYTEPVPTSNSQYWSKKNTHLVKILKRHSIYGGFDFCHFKDSHCPNSFSAKAKVSYNRSDHPKRSRECPCIGADYMEIECKAVHTFTSNSVE